MHEAAATEPKDEARKAENQDARAAICAQVFCVPIAAANASAATLFPVAKGERI